MDEHTERAYLPRRELQTQHERAVTLVRWHRRTEQNYGLLSGIDRDHRVRPFLHDDWTRLSKTKEKSGSTVKQRDGSDFFVRGGVKKRGSVRTDSDSRCDYC